MKDLALRSRDLHGSCIYCYVFEKDPTTGSSHSTLYNCNGAMSHKDNYYYRVFRLTVRPPKNHVCHACWTPTNIQDFNHPKSESQSCPTERRSWEDLFRGIPYIIWRVKEIRHAIFKKLGLSENMFDDFVSVVDYARWLEKSLTNSYPVLCNVYAVVWAFTCLYNDDHRPSSGGIIMKMDGKLHVWWLTLCSNENSLL